MPRQYRGPRLWLDRDRGTWTIIHRRVRIRTGVLAADHTNAKRALRVYAESLGMEPNETPSNSNSMDFEPSTDLMEPGDNFISLREAANSIFQGKTSYQTLRREVKAGRLRAWKFGGRILTSVNNAQRLYDGTTRLKPSINGRGVYVMGYGQYVKIGISQAIKDRLDAIQTHIPEKVEIYAMFEGWRRDELLLHRRFAEYRTVGEWFRKEGKLAEWVDGGCK